MNQVPQVFTKLMRKNHRLIDGKVKEGIFSGLEPSIWSSLAQDKTKHEKLLMDLHILGNQRS